MDITVVDTLPYLDVAHLQIGGFRDKTLRRLDLFDKLGIAIARQDVFSASLPASRYDVTARTKPSSTFHSRRNRCWKAMVKALKAGGRLCLSVPNVARIEMRLRVLGGRTPHESYADYFHERQSVFRALPRDDGVGDGVRGAKPSASRGCGSSPPT